MGELCEMIFQTIKCGYVLLDNENSVKESNELGLKLRDLDEHEEWDTYVLDDHHYRLIEKDIDKGKLLTWIDVTSEIKFKKICTLDEETNVLTSRLLLSQLEHQMNRVRKSGSQMALVLLDVDPGTNGPTLKEIAQTLKKIVNGYDTVFRGSRSDFAIMMFEIEPSKIEHVAGEKILTSLKELGVARVSIGITVSGRSLSAEAMMRQAQRALYVVNSRGGNDYSIY